MSKSPFVVLRYPIGGAGRFLSTAIQCSDDVAFWDAKIEGTKADGTFAKAVVDYTNNKFPADLEYHLRLEPDLPYASDFYSGTYPRGSDLNFADYTQLMREANDQYYFSNLDNNKKVNLILHKSEVPVFMNAAIFINVIVSSKRSEDWVKRMLWFKHYKQLSDNQVLCLTHDANYCNPKRKHLIEKYFSGTSILTVTDLEDFKENEIPRINNLALFKDTSKLYQHESNAGIINTVFDLDNIFSPDLFIDNLLSVCSAVNLAKPNTDILKSIYNIWWSRQQ